MVYKLFDKKSNRSGADAEPNYQLVNELHKQIIRKFKGRKVYSSFRDDIWGVDLADMQSWASTVKELSIYCVQLIYLVNQLHTKEELVSLMQFKK